MNIREFAEKHRLKTRRDECGDTIIPGKDGHIFEYSSQRMGVAIVDSTPKKWGNRRRGGEAVGMIPHLDGHDEGILFFDPHNKEHVKYAIKVARCRQKRVLSEEEKARLVSRLHPEKEPSSASESFLDEEAA